MALASRQGLRGYKLSVDHGEPIPHPKSVSEILVVLQKMMGFGIETEELNKVAAKMAANLETPGVGDLPPKRSGVYG